MRRKLRPLSILALAAAIATSAGVVGAPQTTNAGSLPTMSIDLDPSGTPCNPVDATRTVATGSSLSAAICLLDGTGPITEISPKFDYDDAVIDAGNGPYDNTTDLNANPDFVLAGSWDCNAFDNAFTRPVASPPPVAMGCQASPAAAVGANARIATFNYTAAAGGTSVFTWDGGATVTFSGSSFSSCDSGLITCQNATLTVTGAPANTPTATNTPCPSCTPTPFPTGTIRTVTPTPGGETATPPTVDTQTPAAQTPAPDGGGPGAATAGAGAPGGTIRPPDTGTGGSDGGAYGMLWMAGIAFLLGLSATGAAAVIMRRGKLARSKQ